MIGDSLKHIVDKSIDLIENDLLDSIAYSKTLKRIIEDSPNEKSFTIGLFGEWGSGKSSIIETTKKYFEDEDREIRFIIYDAWKYSSDSFRRTFLVHLFKELCPIEIEKINEELYTDSSKSNIELENILPTVVDGILSKALYGEKIFDLRKNTQHLHYFSPEQFEFRFKEIIETYQKQNKTSKIVIIIDNIDRCSSEDAYKLLSDVKGFLDVKNVIYLIPVDDSALSNQISKYGDNSSEFLRKIFDSVLYIKKLKTTELFDFTKSLNEKYSLGLEMDTLYILSEAYATNPRRIVQVLNNLQIELEFFDEYKGTEKKYEIQKTENGNEISEQIVFSKRYEKEICKLLVIREEWPDFYHEISRQPELLRRRSESVDDWNYSDPSELKIEIDRRRILREQKLTEFLNNTKSITESREDNLISQLMTVKNPFKDIPVAVLGSLNKRNYENRIADYVLEGEHNFTLLLTYVINELETEVRRAQVEMKSVIGSRPEIAKNLDHLLKINELKPIEKFDEKIQNIIESSIVSFITDLEELSSLVRYAYELKERGKSYLYRYIVRMLNVPEYGSSTIEGDFYVNLFLKFVKELDASCCRNVQLGFAKKYEEIWGFDYLFESEEKIKKEKINDLVSDQLIELLMTKFNSSNNENIMKNLDYIASTHYFKKTSFKKIQTIIDNMSSSNRSKYNKFYKNMKMIFVLDKKTDSY